MRFLILAAVLVSACSKQDAATPTASSGLRAGTFVGGGRDALCIADAGDAQQAGLIAYGAGDTNCSLSGRIDAGAGGALALVPTGDDSCRVALTETGDRVTVGEVPAACAYYCGPGASLAGKTFMRSPSVRPVADLAGDPLC